MTATPSSGQRRLLEQSIKDGGVAGIPTSYYRKALDLEIKSSSLVAVIERLEAEIKSAADE